jgi:putative chitinase
MPKADAAKWAPALDAAMQGADITTPARAAAFLAQLAHESAELTRLAENLNYTAEGLLRTWPKRFTPDTAATYARQPERIANLVYAGRYGNGDEASGDGWRFRGRSPMQLTFRDNYRAAGTAIGRPLETQPDLALESVAGSLIAAWYWTTRKLNALADAGDFPGITRAVNGGMTGYDARLAYYTKAQELFA